MYYKEEILEELSRINKMLKEYNYNLDLKIVCGAALLFNGIRSIETTDVDTINKVSQQIKEILNDYSLDINDDALDYIENYQDCNFIYNDKQFSNISIEYLLIGGVIKTKLKNCQDDYKMEKLAYLLEEELGVELTLDGISTYLKSIDVEPNEYDITEFLKAFEKC